MAVCQTSTSPSLYLEHPWVGPHPRKSLSPPTSFPSCSELPTPAEYIHQYPDGPGLYTRASHTGSHRGHPWQTFIVLARPCCSLSCPGPPPAPGPGCQGGFFLTSQKPGRTEFQPLLHRQPALCPGGWGRLILPLWTSVFQAAIWGRAGFH